MHRPRPAGAPYHRTLSLIGARAAKGDAPRVLEGVIQYTGCSPRRTRLLPICARFEAGYRYQVLTPVPQNGTAKAMPGAPENWEQFSPCPGPSDLRTSHGLSKDRLILSLAQGHSRRDTIKSERRRRTCGNFW